MKSLQNKVVTFNNAYKYKLINKAKLHVDIECYKHNIFLKGRENFCKLRKLKNSGQLDKLLSNYSDLNIDDLPRVKKKYSNDGKFYKTFLNGIKMYLGVIFNN